MAFCPACGRAVEAGLSFCPQCGTAYAHDAAAPSIAPVVPVRLDVGDLLGHAFRRGTRDLPAYLPTAGLVLAISALATIAANLLLVPDIAQIEEAAIAEDFSAILDALASLGVKIAIAILVTGALGLVAAGLAIVVSDRLDRGEKPSAGEVWSAFGGRAGNFVATYGLIGLALMGCVLAGVALFFLIVPPLVGIAVALWLAVVWAVAPAASLLSEHRVVDNLRLSARLTKGHRGALFGTLIVLIIAVAVPAGVVATVASFVEAGGIPEPGAAPSRTGIALQSILTFPFQLFIGVALPAAIVRAYRKLNP